MPLLGIRETTEPEEQTYPPEPAASYVFEFFYTPVELMDSDGRNHYEGNVCILYSPGYKRTYHSHERVIRTWFHIQGDGLEDCLERYAIPRDRAMVGAWENLSLIPFLEEVHRHNVQQKPYWEDGVTLLCRTFFRNLSRVVSHRIDAEQASLYQKETLATLRHLRAYVHANLGQRWTVEEMAQRAHLSPSYFSKQFAHYFSVSPIEDLINARIRQAKLLLSYSTLSIGEIAERCGFKATLQFHTSFRKRTGRSPGEFLRTERSIAKESGRSLWAGETVTENYLALLYREPVAYWNFDNHEGIDQDYHFRYDHLTLYHGVAWGDGPRGSKALVTDGTLAHTELADPIVDTSRSFTVCAWVLVERNDLGTEWMTAVSVGNENHCSFYLQYCIRDGCYMFTVTASSTDWTTTHVRGTLQPECGKWVHLTGVHNRETRTIALWENGELSGTLPFETMWKAAGPARFGAAVFWGVSTDFWAGRIAEVRFYDRALAADEIKTIYNHSRED